MEEAWHLYVSHPSLETIRGQLGRMIVCAVEELESAQGVWIVRLEASVDLKQIGKEVISGLREIGVAVTSEASEAKNQITIQSWPEFSKMLSHNKLNPSTILLATDFHSIRFTKLQSDLDAFELQSISARISAYRASIPQHSIPLAVNDVVKEIHSRICINPQMKPLNLSISKSQLDVLKPKSDLSTVILRIQSQIEDLEKTLNQHFDAVLELNLIEKQQSDTLARLKSVTEEATIQSKSDFSDLEQEVSAVETVLRGLQVNLASLKSTRKRPRRPLLKLIHMQDEERVPYMAVYNRTNKPIGQVLLCTESNGGVLNGFFQADIEPYVTLFDLRMFEVDLRERVCVMDGEEMISNWIRLIESDESLEIDRFSREKGPMDGSEFAPGQDWQRY